MARSVRYAICLSEFTVVSSLLGGRETLFMVLVADEWLIRKTRLYLDHLPSALAHNYERITAGSGLTCGSTGRTLLRR